MRRGGASGEEEEEDVKVEPVEEAVEEEIFLFLR